MEYLFYPGPSYCVNFVKKKIKMEKNIAPLFNAEKYSLIKCTDLYLK